MSRAVRATGVQLLVLLFFLALAVLLLGSTWTSPTDTTVGGGRGDPGVIMWFLRWTPFALGRQISPFYSDFLNHPDGINLMWNTWLPLPGLLLAPLTLRWGPTLTVNLLLVLAYGLSSWSAYLAIRRYVPSHGAAVAGGLVYGFSVAMRAHPGGLNLTLVFLLPLLLVLVDEVLVRQRRPVVWLGMVLGLVSAAQVLIGEERFAMTVVLSGVLLLVLVAMYPREVRGRLRYALTAIAIALAVFGVLMALPLKAQLTGPARIQGDITAEERHHSDLLALVTPNRLMKIDPAAANRLSDRFSGSMETYLGIPLLLVVLATAVTLRSRPVVRVGFAMLLACLVLSLGARLRIGGVDTGVGLPWSLMEALPLVRNMIPARLGLFTSLFAGLLLAAALHGLWQAGGWRRRSLAMVTVVAVFAFLAPTGPFRPRRVVETPPFFTTAALRSLPRDGVALLVPFPRRGRANDAMVWQTAAGMWFKMPGGYFIGPDPGGGVRHDALPTTISTTLSRIERGRRPPELTATLRRQIARDFAAWRVDSVIVGPMANRQAMAGFLTELLGRPPETTGGVQLWRDATAERIASG